MLSSVPAEESLNHFGNCFFFPASLSYLLWVLSSGYLFSAKTYYVLFPICYVVWGFFGNYDETTSRGRTDSGHGWIQIFSVKPCMGCVCVRACVFLEFSEVVFRYGIQLLILQYYKMAQ